MVCLFFIKKIKFQHFKNSIPHPILLGVPRFIEQLQ